MRALSLARELAVLGHSVTLIASRSSPGLKINEHEIQDVIVIEMPDFLPRRIRHGGLSPLDTAARMIWTSQRHFDVVHAFDHRPAAFLPAWITHKRHAGLLISDWADLWGHQGIAGQPASFPRALLGKIDHHFEQKVRQMVDGVTVISSDLDRRSAEIGIPVERRMLLPPGASVDLIKVVDKSEARLGLGLPLDAHIAAYSGYAPYDQAFLVQAALEFLRRDPKAMVISCGLIIPSFWSVATTEGLQARLIQYGTLPLSDIGTVLAASDLLMLPYLNSSVNRGRFPNKFGDYLAAGRPVITHRTGDLGEIVEHNSVGVLSSEDPREFAADMVSLFRSPAVLLRLGMRGREFGEREWSWRFRAEQVLGFYQRLMS